MNIVVISGDVVSVKFSETKGGGRLGVRISRQWKDKPIEYWNIAVWGDNAEFLKNKIKEGMSVCAMGYPTQFIKGDDVIVFINAQEIYPLGSWNEVSKPEPEVHDDPVGIREDNEPQDDDGTIDPFSNGW